MSFEQPQVTVRVGDRAPRLTGRAYVPGRAEPHAVRCEGLAASWLVVVFYRGDFTIESPAELQAFALLAPAFTEAGACIAAVSTDSFWTHKAWFESHPLLVDVAYPVLADTTQAISASFGVLDADGSALPATFVVDPEGVVRHAAVAALSTDPEEILDALHALRNATQPLLRKGGSQ